MIKLRDYQEKALTRLGTTGEQLLSICPGGGKTFTAIEYINRHPEFKKVLILTHGTNVLKTQWNDELTRLGIPHGTESDSAERIVIGIPHGLYKKELPKVDLLIVDEAHEFYVSEREGKENDLKFKMFKYILKHTNPDCKLLLTGTPSKFIAKGIVPVIIPGTEVYQAGFLANINLRMVKSKYSVSMEDYNKDDETKTNVKFNTKDTRESVNSLVKEMILRLKEVNFAKKRPNLSNILSNAKLNKFQRSFGSLGKTLIACRNIEQAELVHSYISENGVNCVLSESKNDNESTYIEEFKENPDIQVLVVVRRGILGFNMPELINVVDFTMSRNIDRIYQLYARALREYEGNEKFYFRMCSSINPQIDAYCVSAALTMNNEDFISKYNGSNLKMLEVLVRREPRKKKEKSDPNLDGEVIKTPTFSVDSIMADQILSLELIADLTVNRSSDHWNEWGYAKFGEVIAKIKGVTFVREIVNITEENLLYMIKTGKVDERIYEEI